MKSCANGLPFTLSRRVWFGEEDKRRHQIQSKYAFFSPPVYETRRPSTALPSSDDFGSVVGARTYKVLSPINDVSTLWVKYGRWWSLMTLREQDYLKTFEELSLFRKMIWISQRVINGISEILRHLAAVRSDGVFVIAKRHGWDFLGLVKAIEDGNLLTFKMRNASRWNLYQPRGDALRNEVRVYSEKEQLIP